MNVDPEAPVFVTYTATCAYGHQWRAMTPGGDAKCPDCGGRPIRWFCAGLAEEYRRATA